MSSRAMTVTVPRGSQAAQLAMRLCKLSTRGSELGVGPAAPDGFGGCLHELYNDCNYSAQVASQVS